MNLIDFIIGALLMNAMPHFIFGLTKTHFLGLFGYSPKGNIAYAVLQLFLCVILYCYNYSLEELLNNSFLLGGLAVLLLFFIFGKLFVKFYQKK
jgi:hypothetical protein